MKKKIIASILLLTLVFAALPCQSFATSNAPNPVASSALLLDMTTGEILFEKNAYEKCYPASTTKIMTCILALENLNMNDKIVVDSEVAKVTGNSLYLQEGETIDTGLLLSGTMVVSANDGALALAKAVSGSAEAFADLMNEKAAEIGAVNTHFVNPHGLHDDDHYTTAYDLSLIARYAMQNETFRRVVSRSTYVIPPTDKYPERQLSNTNLLLYDETAKSRVYVNGVLRFCKYEGCIGIKTGYTSQAGGCLVSAAERDGTTLMCIVMDSGSTERFSDSIALLDWGFENYKTVSLFEEGYNAGTADVKRGSVKTVDAVLSEEIIVTMPTDANKSVMSENAVLDEGLVAPIAKGDKIGVLQIIRSGDVIGEYDLVAAADVEEGGILSVLGISDNTAKLILLLIVAFIVLLILIVVIYIAHVKKKQARLKAERERRRAERDAAERALREEWEKSYKNRYRN